MFVHGAAVAAGERHQEQAESKDPSGHEDHRFPLMWL
jgi:hypothetical protein